MGDDVVVAIEASRFHPIFPFPSRVHVPVLSHTVLSFTIVGEDV